MGATQDIYDITEAPVSGWIPLIPEDDFKFVDIQVGHTYVVSTNTNHYAKFRVSDITGQRMVFDWAFQMIPGEILLKRNAKNSKLKVERKAVIKHTN
jgi:hypothetical protein